MNEKTDIEKLIKEGSSVQISPQGFSMYPLLFPGRDEVIIEPVSPDKVKRFDVILYRRKKEGILVLHRVCRHKKEGFYMVGDNQSQIEGPLDASQIIGKMVHIKRAGKDVSIKNPIYIIYSRMWLLLRPVRPLISKLVHALHPYTDR